MRIDGRTLRWALQRQNRYDPKILVDKDAFREMAVDNCPGRLIICG